MNTRLNEHPMNVTPLLLVEGVGRTLHLEEELGDGKREK